VEIYVNKSEPSVQLRKERQSFRRKESKKRKNRRRAPRDRRQSVNEGLLVHLSTRKDRRVPTERRMAVRPPDIFKENQTDPSVNGALFRAVV
jgi:hypothetical protein